MENQPRTRVGELIKGCKEILPDSRTAMVIALGSIALAGTSNTNTFAQDATNSPVLDRPLSEATLNRLSIPDDLPDVVNLHKNDFDGSVAPGTTFPSGFGIVGIDDKHEAMPVKRSWSGTWLLSIIVSKGRMEPVRCVWHQSKLIDSNKIYYPSNNPCIRYWGIMKNPFFFAKDFNGKPGTKVDGAPMRIKNSAKCKKIQYKNYATNYYGPTNMSYPETRGGLYDEMRSLKKNELVWYRFTTKDNKAIYVRTKEKDGKGGWGYLPRGCRTDEVPKGGARKKDTTVPGAKPNSGKIFDTKNSIKLIMYGQSS